MRVILLTMFVIRCAAVYGARILAIESCGSFSHWQYMKSILDVLTKNHQVTAITPLLSGAQENYTEIDASGVFPIYRERETVDLINNYSSVFSMVPLYPESSFERDTCDSFYAFEPVKRILKAHDDNLRTDRYDAIVLEPFYSSCLSYLAYRLQIPEVYVLATSLSISLELIVEPTPKYTPDQSFVDSTINGLKEWIVYTGTFVYVKVVPWLTEMRMKYKKPGQYDVKGLEHNPSAVFSNTHNIIDTSLRSSDNTALIGGIHLKPPKALPEDILQFIEDSSHGVIYVSFGSISSMSTLPRSILQAFVGMFEKVPQRILWKYDGVTINLPKNVITRKWFPQRDILLHPNVKLFISHGGLSGIYEAIDARVPILGFPLFYDQPRNIGFLVRHGLALSMDLLSVNNQSLWKNVQELIYNEKYSTNMKNVSEEFQMHVMNSSKTVDFMFEKLIRKNIPISASVESPRNNNDLVWSILHVLLSITCSNLVYWR